MLAPILLNSLRIVIPPPRSGGANTDEFNRRSKRLGPAGRNFREAYEDARQEYQAKKVLEQIFVKQSLARPNKSRRADEEFLLLIIAAATLYDD